MTSSSNDSKAQTRFPHAEPITLRWGDHDHIGHVNNAKFFTFMESARMGYFRAVGLQRFQEEGIGPALVATNCNFRRQLHYPGQLEIRAGVIRLGGKSFTMAYQVIELPDRQLAAEGEGVIAWANYTEGRALPIPEGLRAAIQAFEAGADG